MWNRLRCLTVGSPLLMCAFMVPAFAAGERYGAYGLFPLGSHRVMAMGGAYNALSDDATGVTYNPAGLAFQSYWADLGGNVNSVWNREVDLNGDGQKDGLPYVYFYYAATFRVGNWGFGIGVNSPYFVELPIESDSGSFREKRTLKLAIETFNLPISYRITDEWSLGINIQSYMAKQRYQFSTTNPSVSSRDVSGQNERSAVSTGVMYRPNESWSVGLSYQPRVEFSMDTSLNSQTGGVNWFRDIVIPAKTALGIAYREKRFIYSLDLDYFEGLENTVYVGSELIPQFRRVQFDQEAKLVLHGGFEWNAISNRLWDLYLRMGTYNEPPRIKGNSSRQHLALGTELRYWILALSVAVDGAEDFTNLATGFGISLKYYL